MKSIIFITLITANSLIVNAQTILNPKISARSVSEVYVQINQIELTDDRTTISFTVRQAEGGSIIFIPEETYIVPSEGGEKLFLQKAKGIEINKKVTMSKNGRQSFKLYFPKIEKNVNKINYRGGNENNNWNFFEININPNITDAQSIILPEKTIINKDGKQWKSITNPRYAAKSRNTFNIYKIELMDTATVLYFEVTQRGGWISVPSESCIQPSNGGDVLYVKSAEGTIINKRRILNEDSGTLNYKLYFPKIDESVKKINFKELNKGGNWSVFEIDVSMD